MIRSKKVSPSNNAFMTRADALYEARKRNRDAYDADMGAQLPDAMVSWLAKNRFNEELCNIYENL